MAAVVESRIRGAKVDQHRQPLRRIVRFSESLGLDPKRFISAGVLDPILGVDVKVFVDPQRLFDTQVPEFLKARASLERYFADTLRLTQLAVGTSGLVYKRAVKRLTFKETKGVGIGFGRDRDDGNGIGEVLARKLVDTATLIQKLAKSDPAIFELLGLFEEDFGPDRLSDLTIHILRKDFLRYTARVSREIGVPGLRQFQYEGESFLVPFRNGTKIPYTLLPLDLIRDLPIATDLDEIEDAGRLNEELREAWRQVVRRAHEQERSPEKRDAKELFLKNPKFFDPLIRSYKSNATGPYDFNADPKGLISWASFAMQFATQYPIKLPQKVEGPVELNAVVGEIVNQFRRNIESHGLNKLLYKPNGKPQREAYAQLLFFASADAYCRANTLDLSPESNAGRGPVDFKISKGDLKVVVELKLSSHKQILHGFTEQLEIYKEAESAQFGYFIVVRVTPNYPPSITQIKELAADAIRNGKKTSVLRLIDGLIQPSASKPTAKLGERSSL